MSYNPGPALSGAEVAAILHKAGFNGDDLVKAVGIAKRESGWRPGAWRTDSPRANQTGDFGLMQINYVNDTPQMRQAVGYTQRLQLLDASVNARVAYQIYSRNRGFAPAWSVGDAGWTASGSPLNKVNLNDAAAAVREAQAKGMLSPSYTPPSTGGGTTIGLDDIPLVGGVLSGVVGTAGGVVDSAQAVGGFVAKLLEANTWVRVSKVIGGAVAIGVGVALIANVNPATVIPLGKVGKAVAAAT